MEYIRGIKQTTLLSLDGQWLYLRAASLCLYPLIFIRMEVKIIFFPILLNTSASWPFCGWLCDVTKSESLGNTEAAATIVSRQIPKWCQGLELGSTEG